MTSEQSASPDMSELKSAVVRVVVDRGDHVKVYVEGAPAPWHVRCPAGSASSFLSGTLVYYEESRWWGCGEWVPAPR